MKQTLAAVLAAGLMTGLAGCIPPAPEPTPAPTPTPSQIPVVSTTISTPPQSAQPNFTIDTALDWLDRPLSPGNWTYRQEQGTSVSIFAEASASARTLLSLRCDKASRRVEIALHDQAKSPLPMIIRTETANRVIASRMTGPKMTQISVTLEAGDPLLDAIAFSNGRFAINAASARAIVLPAWPEITRVVEDCRG